MWTAVSTFSASLCVQGQIPAFLSTMCKIWNVLEPWNPNLAPGTLELWNLSHLESCKLATLQYRSFSLWCRSSWVSQRSVLLCQGQGRFSVQWLLAVCAILLLLGKQSAANPKLKLQDTCHNVKRSFHVVGPKLFGLLDVSWIAFAERRVQRFVRLFPNIWGQKHFQLLQRLSRHLPAKGRRKGSHMLGETMPKQLFLFHSQP